MPKANCKYWDKCYQRKEEHLDKYNHPSKNGENERLPPIKRREAPKRKASTEESDSYDSDEMYDPSREKPKLINNDEKTKDSASTSNEGAKSSELDKLREEALGNIAVKDYQLMLRKRISMSMQREYDTLLQSNDFIRHKFLVEMPQDFFDFWDMLTKYMENHGGDLLDYMKLKYNIMLVGPFEFLAGRFHGAKIYQPGDYLRHWRFFYDPPEFQTVFVRRGTGIHYGYWRDTPQDKEQLLLARNDSSTDCKFEFIAGNIFEAFVHYLEHEHKATPFAAAEKNTLIKTVNDYIEKNRDALSKQDVLEKERNKKVVAKTFHRAGIVVPFESRTRQGYRPLIVSDAELKKILEILNRGRGEDNVDKVKRTKTVIRNFCIKRKEDALEKLEPIANAAHIAMDECDFGTPFELGINLFCSGFRELHVMASSLLVPAYSMLKRPQFVAISKAHMDKRRDGFELSVFDVKK